MKHPYTVVGFYNDNRQRAVWWKMADTADKAEALAYHVGISIVAVFPGHLQAQESREYVGKPGVTL